MKYIKSYKLFESISSDIDEIMLELQDEGFVVEQSYWVRGARGGYLRSDEYGNQFYGPIATDSEIYLTVEVKKLNRTGTSLFKTEGFDFVEVKSYFDRLKSFLEDHSDPKYKIKNMIFTFSPRFTTRKNDLGQIDKWDTSFGYVDSKYIEKDFTDKNTLTSVSYFFERI